MSKYSLSKKAIKQNIINLSDIFDPTQGIYGCGDYYESPKQYYACNNPSLDTVSNISKAYTK
jgi:hypothetical protein